MIFSRSGKDVRKIAFLLNVQLQETFCNEALQQETEFNVCMNSERALAGPDTWHI